MTNNSKFTYRLRSIKKLAAYSFFALGLISSITSPAYATITISQVSPINFGSLLVPASGSPSITVSSSAANSSTLAGGAVAIDNNANRGEYLIKRTTENSTMTVNITGISTGSSALTLSTFTGRYGSTSITTFPKSSLTNPGTAGTDLYLGAKLAYTSAIADGTYNMTYTITVTIP